jgi:hypothetical protein
MARETVFIGQLRLRVPGLDRAQAAALADQVARHLAAAVPAQGKAQSLGALNIRVNVAQGSSPSALASTIATTIAEYLR